MTTLSGPVGSVLAVAMLAVSNVFMTFAWYWHLKGGGEAVKTSSKPLFLVILTSWGLAFLEYCIAVPANRIGAASGLSVAQLKIFQEVITVCVFVPFLMFYLGEKWRWDYLWALLCMVGAVYFVNRGSL